MMLKKQGKNEPEWATDLGYNKLIVPNPDIEINIDDAIFILKGASDIVSNAYDMDKWMTDLVSGKLILRESYQDMSENYTTKHSVRYGYGLEKTSYGVGHTSNFDTYITAEYINENYGYNIFVCNNE